MFWNNKITKTKSEAEERIKKALKIAWSYGQTEGDHHKAWVIDQMVRELCGNDEEYKKFINIYEAPVGYEDYFKWDVGIAPRRYELMHKN